MTQTKIPRSYEGFFIQEKLIAYTATILVPP